LTTYRLTFLKRAKKEWDKLGPDTRKQFSKKLQERITDPRVPADRLSQLPDCYKIKLSSVGYRLVYRVLDDRIVIQVVAVGKRERSEVYDEAKRRI
jgi:mRNA interferase RelE/StbE